MRSLVVAVSLLASTVSPASDSPGDAALSFLRSLKNENPVFAVSDTAISPEIPEEGRADIVDRLRRLGSFLRPDDLQILEEKQDGDIAGVIISQVTNFDSESVQIHAVGMVKKDDRWLAAPLPSSFNSTGLSFLPGLHDRVKGLEEWMLRARSRQMVRLKEDVVSLLADEMEKAKSRDQLQKSSPGALASEFITALTEKDLPAALALVGGLESPRPPEWEETFQTVSRVLRQDRIRHDGWRLLAAPEAVRAIVMSEEEASDGLVSIVAIDPARDFDVRPQATAIHLPFVRSKSGLWRIHLPMELLKPVVNRRSRGDERDPIDADLVALLPERLAESITSELKQTAKERAESMVAALRAPSLAPICSELDLDVDSEAALEALIDAANLWQSFHRPDETATPLLVEVHEFDDDACAMIQRFSAKSPERSDLSTLFLHRKDDGSWLANPGFSGASALSHVKDSATVGKWIRDTLRLRDKNWAEDVVARISDIPEGSAPTVAEARKLVEQWRDAISARDAALVLDATACFDDGAWSDRMLRNVSYEILAGQKGEILSVQRNGRWAAVSMRIPPVEGDDSADAFPLYLVVSTDGGPKILPELDFFDPLTRGRKRLNESVWKRIKKLLPAAATDELHPLYDEHLKLSANARERRPNLSE